MREIYFRGQTIEGQFVYGLLSLFDDKHYISNDAGQPLAYQVRPETIGQYTGLRDKNQIRIYEGDIIEYEKEENRFLRNEVIFDKGQFLGKHSQWSLGGLVSNFECEVRGNIYEDKELLSND